MKKMKGKLLAILIIAAMVGSIAFFAGYRETENSGEISKEFSISNPVFCSEESKGYMDYAEQPGATYKPGDTIWIYMNLEGLKLNPNPDGTKEMWIRAYITLKAPNGDILLKEEAHEEHRDVQANQNETFLDAYINTTPQLTEGKYTVEIIVTDKLGNRTATASSCFIMNNE
jgi:hypothetical protein